MALFSSRIKVLEGSVETLTAERDQLAVSVRELTEANAACEVQHTADQLALTTLTAERDASAASLVTANADLAAARADLAAANDGREAATAAEVTKRLSSAGVDAVKRDPQAIDTTGGAQATGTARERLAALTNAQLAA